MNVPAKPKTLHRDSQSTAMDRDERRSTTPAVLCFGEALWDLQTNAGSTFDTATHLAMTPGGGAVNVAKHLVSLGVRVALAGSVGADAVGRGLKARVAAMGIDVSRLLEAKPRTGLVMMTSAPMRVVAYRSVKEEANAWREALPAAFGATIFHISGLLPSRSLTTALVAAVKRSRRQGCLVSLDANVRPKLWTTDVLQQVGLERLFAEVDVLKTSDDDLRVLGFSTPLDLAKKLRADAMLVVTHGAKGATAIGPFGEIVSATEALAVENTIGAGDAFVAGLLSVLVQDPSGRDRATARAAIERGNKTAAAWLGASVR